MSGSGICFFFGFSSGFICRLIIGKKCDSTERHDRIHQVQTEYNRELTTDRNTNLTITHQPQRAILYNGDQSVPIARARVIS